ncbi:helicase C-terminal domain-containing protein, partial [Escherichia sp. R-CC3]
HLGMLVLFAVVKGGIQRHKTVARFLFQPAHLLQTRKTVQRTQGCGGDNNVRVGLQSFAEGLDLKGDLLSQVHIHKIAFPPIDSPVVITEGEWLKSLNRYPFEVQSLPSASFNLIQQVGRLIRSHGCWGEVVIYDKRLLTKNYGKRLLDALPVFPIEQPEVPE